jgi:hypothetical protein
MKISKENEYVQAASKIDSFMGKIRMAKMQKIERVVADKFVFDHFCGPNYDSPKNFPMFVMEGIEVYQTGKVPDEFQDELQSK